MAVPDRDTIIEDVTDVLAVLDFVIYGECDSVGEPLDDFEDKELNEELAVILLVFEFEMLRVPVDDIVLE